MGSVTGKNFVVATFGESHGPGLGVVIDGLPSGLPLDEALVQADLDRRRPGRSPLASPRREPDKAEILSGLSGGLTNGAPLAMLIRNRDARSGDYAAHAKSFRPGHADWTYFVKYGLPPQPGGGRSSGRETAARVAAGAVARALLSRFGVSVRAACVAVGGVRAIKRDWAHAETTPLRFPDPDLNALAEETAASARDAGDSVGSVVEVEALGVRPGLGDPVFDKLEARLGAAFLSLGAVRAVEFGEGIKISAMRGSEANDPMGPDGPEGRGHGGVLGGVSTGRPIAARLFVKPTPSISLEQRTVDVDGGRTSISVQGRHDPCLGPRVAPVAEAACLIVLADFYLRAPARLDKLEEMWG
ncbi:MAG: chorismate synthase [Deltaproteobacteria bacterium]|jgi:chorismate synthase|nr:chorismate synthase [Deltaproteobacteria bacterium]